MERKFRIAGHSGCDLYYNYKNGNVVKKSKNRKNSKRLRNQCMKQHNFFSPYFKSPEIYDSGENNGLFWFEMENITYKTFDEFLLLTSKKTLDDVVRKILLFIKNNIREIGYVDNDVFLKKYEETKSKIFINHDIDINFLNEFFYDIEDRLHIPLGYCHGDLTFSNILFDGSDMVLVDFLDTFLETPLQDVVKLRQDTKYYWSLRMVEKVQDVVKIKQSLKYVDEIIDNVFSKEEYYMKYYKHFQSLNLLRIIPYSKDREIVDKLMKEVARLCSL